jgi:hypothetical protein
VNERVRGKNWQKGRIKSEWKRIGMKKGRVGEKRWIGGEGSERKEKEGEREER